jgi:hypothetical protein
MPDIHFGRPALLVAAFLVAYPAAADTCIAPVRPYLPEDQQSVREYADLLRQDFELYVNDVSQHFRCLDQERARAFEEAQEVTADYQRLMELTGQE